MRHSAIVRCCCLVASVALFANTSANGDEPSVHRPHQSRQIEGWTVQVDDQLLSGAHAATGTVALTRLAERLADIVSVVPEDKVAKLRTVPIWIDLDHPLERMQYHPAAQWLREHDYDPAMERAVHLPRVKGFLHETRGGHQPWAILHELAHAYHDQVLGFDDSSIKSAFQKAEASQRYESVLRITGRQVKHYALSNHKEYFAEMTEAYFGTNDFYPFVSAELRATDPETYALLKDIWGVPR